MRLTRRHFISALVAPALAAGPLARAQTAYPSRPVRIILPFAAGGGSDVLTRIVAEELGRRLGQRFLVENITGAGGTIGTERVVRADPDGHTLLLATNNLVTINPALYANLAHGVISALLFLVVGGLKHRWGDDDLGTARSPLREQAPVTGLLLLTGLAAGLGLPGLAGFWGEIVAVGAHAIAPWRAERLQRSREIAGNTDEAKWSRDG